MNRTILVLLASSFLIGPGESPADEINVALVRWGAKASASSEFSDDYAAQNALDGRWESRETDKWNTRAVDTPHWLVIDLGRPFEVRRIVVRHEGVFDGGEMYNTRDYRLQTADNPSGPWTDIAPPIIGNKEDVTETVFDPVRLRYIRLYITQGEQDANQFARIFEVEAYADRKTIDLPLAGLTYRPGFVRNAPDGTGHEVRAFLSAAFPPSSPEEAEIEVRVDGSVRASFPARGTLDEETVWLPIADDGSEKTAEIIYRAPGEEPIRINTLDYFGVKPGYFADGDVYIVSSSHQDIAWMNEPSICIRDRDLKVITPALERMAANPDICFSVETTLQLMEYLERHPDRRDEIAALTRAGRLEWGATYHQPYESMYGGEALVRQVYLGRKWLKKALPGCDSHIAWNPDVPGRAMQMPQILAKADIPYLIMSRHEEGFYNWLSPDGSGVVAFSPGHYHHQGTIFRVGTEHGEDGTTIIQKYRDFDGAVTALTEKLAVREDYHTSRGISPTYGVIMSSDFVGPVEMDDLMADWDRARNAPSLGLELPGLSYATGERFMSVMAREKEHFDTIVGERPNVWLYIHGPTHYQAMSACREAGWVLPAAESFAAAHALVSGGFDDYPSDKLNRAWMKAIYPDHGWGGKNGHITDRVFRRAFEEGRDIGRDVLARSTRSISEMINHRREGRPLVVFNHLSWPRTGPVEADIDMFGADSAAFDIVNAEGESIPYQIVRTPEGTQSADSTLRIVFIARDVPPVGYASYYAVPRDDETTERETTSAPTLPRLANEYYEIELANGGVEAIYDRELERHLLQTGLFRGGEVFTMESVGNGAGEFAEVQQPSMNVFMQMSGVENTSWSVIEHGPVRTVCETAAAFDHATVRLRVCLYNTIKRIDFETDLLGFDGTKNREFRMAFPLAMDDAQVAYEVPMGVVEVGNSEIEGAAGERYTQTVSEVHPREVTSWFGASDGNMGVTISSSVAAFDWIDPTERPAARPVLQPILLASRKSCHWEGNWYLQTGSHHFRFSLTSHLGDWHNGWREGIENAQPMSVVGGSQSINDDAPALPASKSFCSVEGGDVMLAAMKKCDDDDSLVLRLCEYGGKDTAATVRLDAPVLSAEKTDIIEENGVEIPSTTNGLTVDIGHHAIETFKIRPELK